MNQQTHPENNTSENSTDTKLPGRIVAAYSSLTLPTAALGLPITVYLPPFFAKEVGLGLATVGLIFTLARLWDVVTDPIMGTFVDRFPSRWGRHKHWIAFSVPILMLATYFIYMPGAGTHDGSYLLVWLVILYLGYTFLTIAHQSWGTELTTDYNERSRLYGWREIASIVGMVTVLVLPAVIERTGGDTYTKIASMGWYLLILLPITAVIILAVVPERRAHVPASIPIGKAIIAILKNQPLRRVLIADISIAFAIGVAGSTYIFLATWVFNQAQYASLILLSYFLAGLASMPIWMALAYRVSKHAALACAMVYACLSLLVFPFVASEGNFVGLLVATVFYGSAFGAGPMILRAMMADLADMDELETGTKRAGLFFALLTTTNKVGAALSVSICYAILGWIGFDPAAPSNSPAATSGLLWTFVLLPALFFSIAAIALWKYPLDRIKHAEIQTGLKENGHRT